MDGSRTAPLAAPGAGMGPQDAQTVGILPLSTRVWDAVLLTWSSYAATRRCCRCRASSVRIMRGLTPDEEPSFVPLPSVEQVCPRAIRTGTGTGWKGWL